MDQPCFRSLVLKGVRAWVEETSTLVRRPCLAKRLHTSLVAPGYEDSEIFQSGSSAKRVAISESKTPYLRPQAWIEHRPLQLQYTICRINTLPLLYWNKYIRLLQFRLLGLCPLKLRKRQRVLPETYKDPSLSLFDAAPNIHVACGNACVTPQ